MRDLRSAFLFLVLPPIIWGSNFAVGRAIHGEIDPLQLNYWRWVIALILLAPFGWRALREAWPLLRARWLWVVALSGLSVVLFNTLVYAALTTLPAAEGALIHAATPLVTMVISAWLLGERFHPQRIVGAAISCTGAVLVIGTGAVVWSFSAGHSLMLLTVVIWALYSVLLKLRPAALPPHALLLAVIAVGVAIQTPFCLALGTPITAFAHYSSEIVAGVIYLGVVASAVAYWLWDKGVAAVGPTIASQFFHVMPLSATVLAWGYLGEAISAQQLAGACLVVLGILCASWHIEETRDRPAVSRSKT